MLVTTDGSGLFSLLICLLFIVAAVILATMIARSGRRRTAPPPSAPVNPADQVPTAQLSDQANAALVAADNALKTSEQELGFAQAQYGAEAVGPFTQALEASRADVAQAFRLRQQLDDDVAEDEPTQRAMLREILDRCAAADQRLDAQAEAFDQLRALESNVDTLLPRLVERRDRTQQRVTAARGSWADVAGRYADGALATVADNVSQAADRLTFATSELDQAAAAVARDDRGAAALAARGAEQSLGQAEALLDAVDKVAADLEAARAGLPGLIADIQADAAAARAAASAGAGRSGGDQVALAAAVARADQVVADAKADLASTRPDPINTLRRLEGVAGELGTALGGVRDAATQARHAREQLDQAMLGARSTVDSAAEFITNRRGAVGAQARTRLAEAQRRLDEATGLAASDPVAAVAAARSAQGLAEQAAAAARDDVTRWSMPTGGGYGGNVVIGGGGGLAGAVLGGILLEGMFGGGMGGGMGRRRPPMGGGFAMRRGFANTGTNDANDAAPGDGVTSGNGATSGNDAAPGNGANGTAGIGTGDEPVPVGRFGGPSTWSRDYTA